MRLKPSTPLSGGGYAALAKTIIAGLGNDGKTPRQAVITACKKNGIGFAKAKHIVGDDLQRKEYKLYAAKSKALGRRVGFRRLDDEGLKTAFDPFVQPSCRPNSKGGVFMTRTSSIASIHRRSKAIRGTYAYSTLCKKVKRGRLSIVKGHKRTDRCKCCIIYDKSVEPLVTKQIDAAKADLKKSLNTYWDEFQRVVDATSDFGRDEFL